MAVVDRPKDSEPPFGGGVQIIIGARLAQQLLEWQRRKREQASSEPDEKKAPASRSPGR
jgi:hypothetical protein